jgi:predicted chitinase
VIELAIRLPLTGKTNCSCFPICRRMISTDTAFNGTPIGLLALALIRMNPRSLLHQLNHNLNALSDLQQLGQIMRIINGGRNGSAQRLALYSAGREALGIG